MSPDTSMGGERRDFHPTLWTVVLRAQNRSPEALEELVRSYWKPIYVYVRRRGASADEAKDLTQGFFAELLEKDALKGASREKGKFRTFLLTVLQRYLGHEARRARARKRGGGRAVLSLDFDRAERDFAGAPVTDETPERAFTRQWALETLDRALAALERETEPELFRALKPHLAGGPAYAETAGRLGLSLSRLNNLIHRARKRYRDLLRAEVAAAVSTPGEVEEELRNLLESLQ
jgi:RNA polymerase sigma-70 factor (ECF subfamily)